MSYFKRARGMGDDQPGSPEETSISSSSTTQDVSYTSPTTTIGGQDVGTPTVSLTAWKNVNGVCITTQTPAGNVLFGQIKELQRQLNRLLGNAGTPLIAVDGMVGSQTIAALSSASLSGVLPTAVATCDQVCSSIAQITAAVSAYADSINAGTVTSPTGTPQQIAISGANAGQVVGQGVADSVGDLWSNLSTTAQISAGGAAAIAAYFAYKKWG